MKKIHIELPKYRLQLRMRLIKRRKPLLEEPLLPKPSVVRRKYRKGSYPGRFARYLFDHKNVKKMFTTYFAAATILSTFIPQATGVQAGTPENFIIESQTRLITEKNMIYPVEQVKINQGYSIFHKALDFGGNKGDIVAPIMGGVVAYAGWDRSGYGNLVILQHKSGIDSYYAHLSKINVKTGQVVDINTIIGEMGATGRASGIHLHLEIHQNGLSLNPLTVLSK